MKIQTAMVSTALALLLAGTAEAQSPAQTMQSGSGGAAGRAGATRRAMVSAPQGPVRHPSFMRHPSFVRHPFFFRRPFFFGSGLIVAAPEVAVPQTYVYSYAYPVYVQNPVYDQSQAPYWAYCRSPQGYYPYVTDCPAGWLPVAPTSPPPPRGPGQTSLDAGQPPKEARSGGDSIEEIRARIARSRAD
jgi:hypothetical protein